jgi:hypothetical protein
MRAPDGWQVIVRHPLRCDICNKLAVWSHPMGGLRCKTCPRPDPNSVRAVDWNVRR